MRKNDCKSGPIFLSSIEFLVDWLIDWLIASGPDPDWASEARDRNSSFWDSTYSQGKMEDAKKLATLKE